MRAVTIGAVLTAILAVSGCATDISGTGPGTGSAAGAAPSTTDPAYPQEISTDSVAGWADGGAAIALVTWGSGSCVPVVADVETTGQEVSVTFAEPTDMQCTADLRPRGTYIAIPPEVDRTTEVTISDGTSSVIVAPQGEAYAPDAERPQASASWVPGGMIAVVTYGSSSCPAEVASIENETATGMSVELSVEQEVCTEDYAPRLLLLGSEVLEQDATVTLLGAVGGTEGLVVPVTGTPTR